MWRGVTRWKPIFGGASFVRAGWLKGGKLVHYPIRNRIDEKGGPLVNWLWELETPDYKRWDWNRPARVEDFIAGAESRKFEWLDVPAFFRAADLVLEYPMVDKDPLPAWSFGRLSLLGDAAHPMYPRGSNGAGQAILDARALAGALHEILREIYERTGERPFERIDSVISHEQLRAISDRYKGVAGYDQASLRA